MSHDSQYDDANIRDREINRLVTFIKELKSDLEDFIENYDALIPHYPEFKESFVAAWEEVSNDFEFIIEYLMKLESLEELSRNGLTGKQLDLKLQLITTARAEVNAAQHVFYRVKNETENEKNEPLRKRIWNKIKNKAAAVYRAGKKILLQYDDTLLGSLVETMPVIGHSIVEIKDTAINLLEKEISHTES